MIGSFVRYEKMVDSPRRWQLDEAAYRTLRRVRFAVTEKIHGANFSLLVAGDEVRFCHRKGEIGAGEDFFGHRDLAAKLTVAGCTMAARVRRTFADVRAVTIFGELFGGGYPHPEVPRVPHVQPIQTGVWYCPHIAFAPFDIAIDPASAAGRFLDYEFVREICAEADLPAVAPLFVGRFEEAHEFPIEFATRMPDVFGLPPLADNMAEGIVVRPVEPMVVPSPSGPQRPIFKRKTVRFTEDSRYLQATKWPSHPPFSTPLQTPAPLAILREMAPLFVTVNRLHAAISKVGRLDARDRARSRAVFALFVDDVLETLADEFPAEFAALTTAERAGLVATIRVATRDLFRHAFADSAG